VSTTKIISGNPTVIARNQVCILNSLNWARSHC